MSGDLAAVVADLRRCERNRAIDDEKADQHIVRLAALCFLSWKENGEYPWLLADGLSTERIAEAIDAVSAWPTPSEAA
jgi:hypothetical protein